MRSIGGPAVGQASAVSIIRQIRRTGRNATVERMCRRAVSSRLALCLHPKRMSGSSTSQESIWSKADLPSPHRLPADNSHKPHSGASVSRPKLSHVEPAWSDLSSLCKRVARTHQNTIGLRHVSAMGREGRQLKRRSGTNRQSMAEPLC